MLQEVQNKSFPTEVDISNEISGLGTSNKVFKCISKRYGDVIVRVSTPDSIGTYLAEKEASNLMRESGVKTPEILEVGFNEKQSYSVQSYHDGLNGTLFLGDINETWRDLGKLTAEIHTIKPETKKIKSLFKLDNTKTSALNFLNKNDSIIYPQLREQLKFFVEKVPNSINKEAASLIHGDIRPRNSLVCSISGEVLSVLDLGNCLKTTPFMELGVICLNADPKYLHTFLHAYSDSEEAYSINYDNLLPYAALHFTVSAQRFSANNQFDKLNSILSKAREHIDQYFLHTTDLSRAGAP